MKQLIEIQELVMSKLHPAFVKGFISIAVGLLTFWSMFFDNPEVKNLFSVYIILTIKFVLGSLAMFFNQFRDAISAYYTEKQKSLEAAKPTTTEGGK